MMHRDCLDFGGTVEQRIDELNIAVAAEPEDVRDFLPDQIIDNDLGAIELITSRHRFSSCEDGREIMGRSVGRRGRRDQRLGLVAELYREPQKKSRGPAMVMGQLSEVARRHTLRIPDSSSSK